MIKRRRWRHILLLKNATKHGDIMV